MANIPFGNSNTIPGNSKVNTLGQFYPSLDTPHANSVGASGELGNGVMTAPKNFGTQTLSQMLENLRLINDTFEASLSARGQYGFRSLFDKDVIPQHSGTFARTYIKSSGIDNNPLTAAVSGITGWNPSMNEVSMDVVAVEATTNMWGRFYKKHRFMDDFSSISYYAKLAEEFANNAAETMENLAKMRLYEGAQKVFVQSVSDHAAAQPGAPIQPRLALGSDASAVGAQLTWDALLEVKYEMQNHQGTYCTIDPSNGTLKKDNKRVEPIGGWKGGTDYLVLVSPNGWDQLLNDPEFIKTYVVNGGMYASVKAQNQTGMRIYGLDIQVIPNGLFTISKEASPKLNTDGTAALEVAFVLGGNARMGIELSYAGWTGMINVGYEEDKKLDPFSLLSIVGWYTITDFTVIRNEGVYAIPHVKHTYIESGNIIKPANPNWK